MLTQWPRFLEHQAELCRVGQQAEALAKRLASPGVTEDQHELKKDLQDWRESVSAVGSICLRMPIKFWIWAVVRFLVSSGCQLIWPDVWTATPGRPLLEAVNCSPMRKSPRLAAEQLSAVATSLSELIGWWEDHRINIRGHSCAPAGLVYAKAMLQWFQWLLQQTGHRSEDPIDARMKHTVRGWAPAARSRPGGHSISQALLLSQAMASGPTDEETSELMVAMLPATVALAMLLAGAGLPSNAADNAMLGPQHLGPVKSFSIGSSLLVPVKLPGFRDGAEDEPASEDAVPVEWVQVGRRRALEVGKGHLEGVLKRIRLGDAPLNLAACKDVDVGYSAIIWQAVGLYQTIQNYLDGM